MKPWSDYRLDFMNSPAVMALGWALLHFVWQGALASLACWAAMQAIRRDDSKKRYAVSCACLVAMVMCVPVTWWVEYNQPSLPAVPLFGSLAFELPRAAAEPVPGAPLLLPAGSMLPWLVAAWAAGVAGRGMWSAAGWWVARRTALEFTAPLSDQLTRTAFDLARRLGMTRPFRVVAAARGGVPFVFGWLKPVLIVPVATMTGLSGWQLEAVLAHELAHIARRDALVNLFQTAGECLLFFHPAVWWVSRRIREEREHCCDDLAVDICGDRLQYSRALLALEETRSAWMMAAGGAHLAGRIARLLDAGKHLRGGPIMPVSMLIVLTAFLGSILAVGQPDQKPNSNPPATTGTPGGSVVVRNEVSGIGKGAGVGSGSGYGAGSQTSGDRQRELERAVRELQRAAEQLTNDNARLREELARLESELRRLSLEQKAPALREQEAREMAERQRHMEVERSHEAAQRAREELEVTRNRLQELQRQQEDRTEEIQRLQQKLRSREMELQPRVRFADERFKSEGGRNSDRGAVYIQYGPPTEIDSSPSDNTEIWRYREIPEVGKNVEFRFEGRPLKKVSGPVANK